MIKVLERTFPPRKGELTMTQQQATQSAATKDLPQAGETYRCDTCGMELEITQNCQCKEGTPLLACCGEQMTKV
jgi:hypothetical protein